ncbi:Homoserine/homoserine lactone efflux protein [compost metagenome]
MLLKLAGALYLVYLGIKQWRSKTSVVADAPVVADAANPNSFWKLFRQGLTVALTNPKAILFFSALFPQFITPGEPVAIQFTVLTTSFVACAMLAHLFYANLARLLKTQLATPGRAKLFNRITGGAFVLLGLSLLRLRSKAA